MRTSAARLLIVCAVCALFSAAFAGPASAVTATWTLTVEKTGPGTVTGDGIDCGTDCSETYSNNCAYDPEIGHVICDPSSATVTATPASGYTVQWSGCDQMSGNGCTVTGGTNATVTANFADTQAPSVALTAPAAGAKHGTITLAAAASDNVGVSRVDFYVGGGVPRASDTTPPYSATFDTTRIADGSALVEAKAVDDSGNMATSPGTTITIDNTAPVLGVIAGPGAGPFGPGTTQDFSWTVSDSTSGLSTVRCKLDNGTFDPCTTNTSMSYTDLPEGAHGLSVRATDNAGNTIERTYAWTIDATAPVAQFTSGPADGSSSTDTSAAFTFTANEPSSFQCRFYAAVFTPPGFAACTSPDSFSVSGLGVGSYVLEVMPVDGVGNAGAPIKRTFTVTAPVSSSTNTGTGSGSGAPSGGDAGGSPPPAGSGTPANTTAKQEIAARVGSKWSVKARKSRAKLLTLSKLPAGASVKVACKGKGCPFKTKRFKPKAGAVVLTKRFKKALAAGTRITITITAPGMTGQQITFVTQKKKQPKRTTKPLA